MCIFPSRVDNISAETENEQIGWIGFLVGVMVEIRYHIGFKAGISMKLLIKTQVLSIIFAIFWVLYLNLLAFFNQPGRAMEHINLFVFGFVVLFAIVYFVLTKFVIGRNWLAVPLVIIPYLMIYQPILQRMMISMVSKGYGMIIKFLALSTGTIHLLAILISMVVGIVLSNKRNKA